MKNYQVQLYSAAKGQIWIVISAVSWADARSMAMDLYPDMVVGTVQEA